MAILAFLLTLAVPAVVSYLIGRYLSGRWIVAFLAVAVAIFLNGMWNFVSEQGDEFGQGIVMIFVALPALLLCFACGYVGFSVRRKQMGASEK